MKLSESHYLQLLDDFRLAFLTKSENRQLYFDEVKNRLKKLYDIEGKGLQIINKNQE